MSRLTNKPGSSAVPRQDSIGQNVVWLLTDLARLLRRDFDRRVRALGLTQPQWRAIGHLARHAGINQAELAERLEVKPITVTRMIDRMQAAGWVERVADETDRRVSRLFLTSSVQPILDELREHANAAIEDLMHGIAANDRKRLLCTLEAMKGNLTRGPSSGGRKPRTQRQ